LNFWQQCIKAELNTFESDAIMKFVRAVLFAFLILSSLSHFTVSAKTVNTGIVGEVVSA